MSKTYLWVSLERLVRLSVEKRQLRLVLCSRVSCGVDGELKEDAGGDYGGKREGKEGREGREGREERESRRTRSNFCQSLIMVIEDPLVVVQVDNEVGGLVPMCDRVQFERVCLVSRRDHAIIRSTQKNVKRHSATTRCHDAMDAR